jgi:hypothetical protein
VPRTLLTLAAVLAALLVAAGAFAVAGLAFGHTEERTPTVRGTITHVVVEGASGDVSLLGASVREATVHERRHFGWRRPELSIERHGSLLRVAVHCAAWSGHCADDIDIVVPRGVQARVHTRSGDIHVAGLVRRDVIATSGSGDVAIR